MSQNSFTLIELIVVIAIIAILAAAVAPSVFIAVEKAKVTEGIGDFKQYKTAIYALYADTGHWPFRNDNRYWIRLVPRATPLDQNIYSWSGWDGPYVEQIKSRTPWGGYYNLENWRTHDGAVGVDERDMWLDFEDYCFPGGPHACPIPDTAVTRLDEQFDDGNCATGDFQAARCTGKQTWGDIAFILVWDIFPP